MKLKQIIYEIMIYDGLEMTHSIESALNNLLRQWGMNGSVTYQEQDETIKMIVQSSIDEDKFNSVIRHIENVLGYFPSHITTPTTNFKYEYRAASKLLNSPPFAIYFDAKYDQEISKKAMPDIIYHISPSVHVKKILKIGLVPKTKNKLSTHPARIYFTTSLNSVKGLLGNDAFKKSTEFTIFAVNFADMKKTRKVRFFSDPAYSVNGIYTYENIPPKYLSIYETTTNI
jgi:hypothetical protein